MTGGRLIALALIRVRQFIGSPGAAFVLLQFRMVVLRLQTFGSNYNVRSKMEGKTGTRPFV
jgi:hypothetical protein